MLDFVKVIIVSLALLPFPILVSADDESESLAEGGRLYDKWWEEYELRKPTTTHPSYPGIGKQKGANTWRCKECHGWDYRGKDGAYAKGSHFTGIKGISSYASREPSEILAILKNTTHQYDTVMLDYGLMRLALFVSKGQFNLDPYIDKDTKKVSGNVRQGKTIYKEYCVDCHGDDGRERNFKSKESPEYVGTVANKNPWEAMHKQRNGHPGAFVMGDPMPSMISNIDTQAQLDLLAYLQTLPKK